MMPNHKYPHCYICHSGPDACLVLMPPPYCNRRVTHGPISMAILTVSLLAHTQFWQPAGRFSVHMSDKSTISTTAYHLHCVGDERQSEHRLVHAILSISETA